MEKEDVLDMLRALRSRTDDLENIDKSMAQVLQTLLNKLDNYDSIDHEFVAILKNYLGDDLLDKESYNDTINAIKTGSTVVYFKSAQLFKIYKKDELYSLLSGQLRTIYKQFVESYEIVPNDSKQKIIIMGEQSLIKDIKNIKTHICKFMQTKGIDSFKEEDIVCFKNNTMLEIIINNYYVSNSTERDAVVKDLLQYMFQTDKNTAIVSKLGRTTFSDFTGSDMISMPSGKQLLNGNFVEYIDSLVGNIEKCSKLDKQGNVYNIIVNVVNGDNATINNADTLNITHVESENDVDKFVEHLQNDLPSWYVSGNIVDYDKLYSVYHAFSNNTKKIFTIRYDNVLFVKAKRVVKNKKFIQQIRLLELPIC
jgi:hypothetical protein